jgi:putative acetyltransferase
MIAESDALMHEPYPAESNHLVDVDALAASDAVPGRAPRRRAARIHRIADHRAAHAEMKRLFVRRVARGVGLGRRLIGELEGAARLRHVERISLETGIRQPEAIALYRMSGYAECEPFGTYKPDPLSLFMTKPL